MNNQKPGFRYRNGWILLIVVVVVAVSCILPVAASDTPTQLGVIPGKSDIANLAFANQPAGFYYFKFDQTGGGGINAIHITSGSTAAPAYGEVSTTTSQSGTFYITQTGGRGYDDDFILLVAVKGEIPNNFALHLKSSGYSWTPTGELSHQPTLSEMTYHAGAVDSTFTKSQFVYGPQSWKPAGNNPPKDYPLYYGQDMSDSSNLWKLMFVDLKAGNLGPNGDLDVSTLTDNGAIKVEYSIENLDKVATFNVYAYTDNAPAGHGISWTNGLASSSGVPSMISGYTVLGPEYTGRASEFPTTGGSAPVFHEPETNFTANVTSGTAPLAVQFNDTTTQKVKNWFWDFGDGRTSTSQNPVHTYVTGGNFTVSLSTANNQGIVKIKEQPAYISVNPPVGGSSAGTNVYYGDYVWSGTDNSSAGGNPGSLPVNFTANATTGLSPLAVQFHNIPTGLNATGWAWDFNGDSVPDSFDRDPVFVFDKIGNYSVNLTVTSGTGRLYNLTLPDYIQVTETMAASGDSWVSSDQSGAGQGSTGSDPPAAVAPGRTTTTSPAAQGTGGYSPLGTKIAGTLLDAVIVVGVIGAGVIVWKKI